jgi:hypothetical protein
MFIEFLNNTSAFQPAAFIKVKNYNKIMFLLLHQIILKVFFALKKAAGRNIDLFNGIK